MGIISWIIVGLIAGVIAWLPRKLQYSMALGVIGALIGGLIAGLLGFGGYQELDQRSLIVAVVGSVVLLLVLGRFRK